MDPMGSRPDDAFLDVSGILEPTSIVVIGASERLGNLGGDTVRRLVKFGFPGPAWPVSRTAAPGGRFAGLFRRPPRCPALHTSPCWRCRRRRCSKVTTIVLGLFFD